MPVNLNCYVSLHHLAILLLSMQQPKRAVILMNLGSPDSPSTKNVKKYLDQFLMDGRVIDLPYLLRSILVKGIITPFRSAKSAEAYSVIWTENGSPLVHITRQLCNELQKIIDIPVEIAMRYGAPDMIHAYNALMEKHQQLEEVVLLPLYPHYAMSSYETALVHAQEVYEKGRYPFKITTVPIFYNHSSYINALAASIEPYIRAEKDSHLLFSYHSIPERHIHKSDTTGNHCLTVANCCEVASPAHSTCYRHQCLVTTKLVCEKMGIPKDKYSVSFQSKLGRSAWLTPATTARMEQMPGEGIKKLIAVCPSFVSDCLETLEEVAIREKENFMNAGGETFTFIPCMNIQPLWVKAVKELVGG